MRYAVMGAGCVGSVVATRLADSGFDVSLVAEGERASRLARDGLTVNGRVYRLPLLEEGCAPDLVFMCVKNYQLREACSELAPYLDGDTAILPLLNSITPAQVIGDCLPGAKVLYGYISRIDACRAAGGFSYHIAGDIHFGYARNESPAPFLEDVAADLETAGFTASVDADMRRSIWRKWMLNVGANQVSALAEADYVDFGRIPEIEAVLRAAMGELLELAWREGVSLEQSDVDGLVEYLMTYPYPKKTSMLQDVLARRKTEIEAISGEVVALGERHALSCPVNATMYNLIRAKEQTYLDGRDHDEHD